MSESHATRRLPAPVRLGRRHKRVAMLTLALLWCSGALWLLFHYFLTVQGPFGAAPHPLESWWLRLHGLAMMLSLAVLGSLWLQHVTRAWQLRKNRRLGAALTALLLWLAATGYALFYLRSDANDTWLPVSHWLAGLVLPLALGWHIRRGRARAHRLAANAAHSTPPHLRAANQPARSAPADAKRS